MMHFYSELVHSFHTERRLSGPGVALEQNLAYFFARLVSFDASIGKEIFESNRFSNLVHSFEVLVHLVFFSRRRRPFFLIFLGDVLIVNDMKLQICNILLDLLLEEPWNLMPNDHFVRL